MTYTLKDKFIGILTSGCIGDVLGSQNENMSFDEINTRGRRVELPDGSKYTDDTEMTIVLGKHIILYRLSIDVDRLHRSYSDVIKSSRRGYSEKTRNILTNYHTFTSVGSASTNGCIMRISPLAMIHYNSDEELRRKIINAVYCTHGGSKDSVDVCVLYVKLLKSLMYDTIHDVDNLFEYLLRTCAVLKNTKLYSLIKLISLSYTSSSSADVNVTAKLFGHEFMQINAIDCFACALFAFAANFLKPLKAIEFAANMGGDTDTISKLVGELIGATYGTGWIPAKFSEFEGKDELTRIAMDIWKMRFVDL